MWLASISRHNEDGTSHAARDYSQAERREAYQLLKKALQGVGDVRWGRSFRMCLTQCLHRGLSDKEISRLPAGWKDTPALHIAGAPVEVFWSRGVSKTNLSALPCREPGKEFIDADRDIYIPVDCGFCSSCEARARIQRDGVVCSPAD